MISLSVELPYQWWWSMQIILSRLEEENCSNLFKYSDYLEIWTNDSFRILLCWAAGLFNFSCNAPDSCGFNVPISVSSFTGLLSRLNVSTISISQTICFFLILAIGYIAATPWNGKIKKYLCMLFCRVVSVSVYLHSIGKLQR